MNHAITAVIKKDFRAITANRRLFLSLLIVPLVLTVFVPGVFISIAHFMPEDEDIQMLLELTSMMENFMLRSLFRCRAARGEF